MYEYSVDGINCKYHNGSIYNFYAAVELAQAVAKESDAETGITTFVSVLNVEDNTIDAICTATTVFMPV